MSTEVFVSYSSQDYERVMPLVDRLRSAGVAVWVDEGNIDAATLWSESIVEAIAECRVLIMMVSSHSTDSHNVVKEVMIASESKKTILPIYLESADIPAKLKYQLTGIQHLEWFDGGNDEVFETLKDGLAKRGVTIDGKTPTNQALGQAADDPQSLADLRMENAKLREEVNQFAKAKGWEQRIPWRSKLARIVGRDSFNWWRRIKINMGTNKEIRLNQPVVSVRGELVGRISEVGPLTSWVLLVGDPNCRFSALLKESRNQGGIVAPRNYNANPRMVELTYLPNDVEVRPGQAVVTSGLGGGFPKEIPVGQVVDSWVSKDGLYTEARIRVHADLNQLESVRVLTQF